MALYRIGTAARLSGVPIETIRNWERRYRVVIAARTKGRQWLYSRDDVERLRLLKHWTDQGYSAREAHALLQHRERDGIPAAASSGPWVREQARQVRAAAAAERARSARLADWLRSTSGN